MRITIKKRKLTIIGGSKGFIIPKPYIENGQIEEDKEYKLTISPSEVTEE